MKGNEASWDRIVRIIAGVALIVGGFAAVGGVGAWIMAVIGVVLLVTALVGWCPIYATFRTGTKRETPKITA
ncbi:MAG: hypothetical protein BMS9Abin20_1076 [Acidimicrobiia bacterium]|nr:MAG: hypothetical protein BMS9Abin20_1076 [Acidimicrobiia bacterium]